MVIRFQIVQLRIMTLLGVLTLLCGCRAFTNPGEVRQVHQDEAGNFVHRISWDATRRGTYVVATSSGGVKIISEPPPDVALETISKLSASISPSAAGTGGTGSIDTTETIRALTRAVEISFLRESLFRIGEAFVNGGLDQEQYHEQTKQIIRAAMALVAIGIDKEIDLASLQSLINSLSDQEAQRREELKALQMQLVSMPGEVRTAERLMIESQVDSVQAEVNRLGELRRKASELIAADLEAARLRHQQALEAIKDESAFNDIKRRVAQWWQTLDEDEQSAQTGVILEWLNQHSADPGALVRNGRRNPRGMGEFLDRLAFSMKNRLILADILRNAAGIQLD